MIAKVMRELERIRIALDDFENMDDGSEMIDTAQRLSCDIESLETLIMMEEDDD